MTAPVDRDAVIKALVGGPEALKSVDDLVCATGLARAEVGAVLAALVNGARVTRVLSDVRGMLVERWSLLR